MNDDARLIDLPPHQGRVSDQWGTPHDFFARLHAEFDFNLDVAAEAWNARCKRYYTPKDDGLRCLWRGRVWCNPPYSDLPGWMMKAHREVRCGNAEVVVMLIPVWADQPWWHDYVLQPNVELRFVRGRLKFRGKRTGTGTKPRFASAIAVIRPEVATIGRPAHQ